jgi:hypothetical protein
VQHQLVHIASWCEGDEFSPNKYGPTPWAKHTKTTVRGALVWEISSVVNYIFSSFSCRSVSDLAELLSSTASTADCPYTYLAHLVLPWSELPRDTTDSLVNLTSPDASSEFANTFLRGSDHQDQPQPRHGHDDQALPHHFVNREVTQAITHQPIRP